MHTNDWKVGFSQVEIHLFLDGFLKVLKQIGFTVLILWIQLLKHFVFGRVEVCQNEDTL